MDELSDDELGVWLDRVIANAKESYPSDPTTLAYGQLPQQVLDIWGNPHSPLVVICVHGGYFAEEYGRSVNEALARRLAKAGALVVNLEYRRSGSIGHPSQSVDDVRSGVRYALKRYPGAERVIVLGHSAGGYLCIATSAVPGVTSVLPLAPLTHLRDTANSGYDEGAIARWMGSSPDEDPKSWEVMELDSMTLGAVRCTIIHGSDDRVVPIEHSVRFASLDRNLAGQTRLIQLPKVGHYEFLDPDSSAVAMVLKVLGLDSVA